jgi:hypothetical protein
MTHSYGHSVRVSLPPRLFDISFLHLPIRAVHLTASPVCATLRALTIRKRVIDKMDGRSVDPVASCPWSSDAAPAGPVATAAHTTTGNFFFVTHLLHAADLHFRPQ